MEGSAVLLVAAAGVEGFGLYCALFARKTKLAFAEALQVAHRTARLTPTIFQDCRYGRLSIQVTAGHDAPRHSVRSRHQHRPHVRRQHQHGGVGRQAIFADRNRRVHQVSHRLLGGRFLQIAGAKHAYDALSVADRKVMNAVLSGSVQGHGDRVEDVQGHEGLSHQAR